MVIKGQKARKAMVFGINGVLEPVKRNCDEYRIHRGLVSRSVTVKSTWKVPRCRETGPAQAVVKSYLMTSPLYSYCVFRYLAFYFTFVLFSFLLVLYMYFFLILLDNNRELQQKHFEPRTATES